MSRQKARVAEDGLRVDRKEKINMAAEMAGVRFLENVLKMQEERAGKTRACAVFLGQMRHRLFLVKRQDRGPFHIMQIHHLKVSKKKTTWPNHVDKRYERYKKMLMWPKDMQGTRVRATK